MLPKIQHYVPQFILKNFSANEALQIYVFDKKEEKIFQTNIKNVAAENGFYNFKNGETMFSAEFNLGSLEASSAEVIENIIQRESISRITQDQKLLVSMFIAAQFSRTKQHRLMIKQMNNMIVNHIEKLGGNPKNIKGFTPFSDDNEIDKFAITTLKDNIQNFAPIFFERGWILFKSTESKKYYISDNPVTMHNGNDYGPMGNLGLNVKGIEVYFPLSSTLSLGIYDEHNQEIIRESYKQVRNLKPYNMKKRGISKIQKQNIKDMMRGLESGDAIPSIDDVVVFQNSMQVASSSRFVYSTNQEFDLVIEMLKANPEMKDPPQVINANP